MSASGISPGTGPDATPVGGPPARTSGSGPAPGPGTDGGADIRAVPVRRPGRWVATVVVVLFLVLLVKSLVTNPNYQWGVVATYFTEATIVEGLRLTLVLTVVCQVIGIALGVLLAVMRGSRSPVVSGVAGAYVWFFRGTPLLVQLIFWFNLSALYPHLALGVPFGPDLLVLDANRLVTPLSAAVLGLSLNEGAYMAEIVRAGIVSIDQGQHQAAASIGMTRLQTMRRIVLPQAMRVIIPPTGNNTITMLKNVSLVSVLAIPDLLYSAQIIYARTFETIPLLLVASIWYLLCTSVLTVAQTAVERHFHPDRARTEPFLHRWRRNVLRPRDPAGPGVVGTGRDGR